MNGEKIKNKGNKKYYEGEYDISDFNELMYETTIEVFNTKTDENNCLTLDGKKNIKNPIGDGVSLLENISYFTSRKINKRAKNSYLDIYYIKNLGEGYGAGFSDFDRYAFKKFLYSEGGMSRLAMYSEYLGWMQRNDVCKLFKGNACDIKAIIETIMNCKGAFLKDKSGDMETGFGMRLVTQETLQEIIRYRHNLDIKQENISADMERIEQRLLDHLFYSLNYEIGKAGQSGGIYEKESQRFLYDLDKKAYIKMFNRTSYKIYMRSIMFIDSNFSLQDYNNYFDMVMKHVEMVLAIISKEKGKKKYDMVNLMSDNDYDLVDDKKRTLLNIANTMISFYQKEEGGYRREYFGRYKMKSLKDWDNGFWEAYFQNGFLNVKLWSNRNVKKPIWYNINKENVMVYCGYMNFYFCDKEGMICYEVPKERRVIGKYNKKHELFLYFVG